MYKETAFTRRLVTLNHTFNPAGGSTTEVPHIAHIWTEEVAGRTGREMASSLLKFLRSEHLPEGRQLTLWLDNCCYQNKNYCLFQTLFDAIRQRDVPWDEVTLKYFVSGHSYMASDSFHAKVEQRMKEREVILNLKDFVVSKNPDHLEC